MNLPSFPRRLGMPLAMQMVAILVCVLVAAQVVTLALTVLLPPQPAARWNMDEVAAALLPGGATPGRLERSRMSGPPDVRGQGWLVSESSRAALAQRLGREPRDVVLAFYTQLPVGGVAVPVAANSPLAGRAKQALRTGGSVAALLVGEAQAQAIPGGPPAGGSPGPGGMPGGGFPGGRMPGGGMPGGSGFPGRGGFPGSGGPRSSTPPVSAMPRTGSPQGATQGNAPRPAQARPAAPAGQPGAGTPQPKPPGSPPAGAAPSSSRSPDGPGRPGGSGSIGAAPPGAGGALRAGVAPVLPIVPPSVPRGIDPEAVPARMENPSSAASPTPASDAPAPAPSPLASTPAAVETTAPVLPPVASDTQMLPGEEAERLQPLPFRRASRSIFQAASPPFIEGDFVAAARQSDGSWLAVAPRAEPFPNAWQKRVMLWFALSLAIVSPLAWIFVRRIVVPLRDFARAAEQLGRDPSATILPLSGPSEIGRAANAFNQMRNRLRAFVDDRTAMVGAISHDLRTPLTRLRFRIEDVPDAQREGLLKEVTEMEAMISQVIGFIRDASTPGPRERVDFAELVAGSVADAQFVGGRVEIERSVHIPVDVDPVGIRRLLGNLLENAVKYGESARVRVTLTGGEAVAEIVDAGPGLPEDEFDRAFEPFYRSDAARRSGRAGSGLGLAVCRSIARAHGGDVSFARGQDGFVARVAVPAAFDPALRPFVSKAA